MRKLFLLFTLLTLTVSYDAEISLAANSTVVKNIESHFHSQIADLIKHIDIPDIPLVDWKIIKCKFTNNTVEMSNYTTESISLDTSKENLISVSIKDVKAVIDSDVKSKLFVNNGGHLTITLTKINLHATLQIKKASPLEIDLKHLDISYDMHLDSKDSNFLKFILWNIKIWDKAIHKTIVDYITKNAKKAIKENINKYLNGQHVPTVKGVEFAMTAEPVINQGFLIAPINVDYFVEGVKLEKHGARKFNDFYNINGEQVQVRLNYDQVSHILELLHRFAEIKFSIKDKDLQKVGLHLRTTEMEPFFEGLVNKYGKDVPVLIEVESTMAPSVYIRDENIYGQLRFRLDIFIMKPEKKQFFLSLFTTIDVELTLEILKDFVIEGHLFELEVHDTVDAETSSRSEQAANFEDFLNFIVSMAKPVVNDNLKHLQLQPFSVFGIKFNNSTAQILDDYLKVEITPVFEQEVIEEITEDKQIN